MDFVLHQAAIGSVPRSFDEPDFVDRVNVGGFVNMMRAAKDAGTKRFVYASSSAVYGDCTQEPNREDQPLRPLSPYAVGKYTNELYAQTLGAHWGLQTVGFRYFNIFGPRQDPAGAYAAIPKWMEALRNGEDIMIFGDGLAERDFCYVGDVAAVNILAALSENTEIAGQVYNVGTGQSVTLLSLLERLKAQINPGAAHHHKDARTGDIAISRADVSKLEQDLGFSAKTSLDDGISNIL